MAPPRRSTTTPTSGCGWLQIPAEGTYHVTTDGKVNGYINPQLAFGHDSSYGWLAWAFAGLFALGLVELTASIIWVVRSRQADASASATRAVDATATDRYTADRRRDPHRGAEEPCGAA